ncbi:serine/threonine protein kinase [Myxococcus qinghaiensis]|uniref:serine/threonine protein kinase n=1 Tax=Myxococcus qinghaiensis TaxID=2906758 RepID=UPI0020A783F6|nr:serine/threonine protein kinase [Myxococcus qinghaiensis]MCP3163371.1 protein kinase [Myxococcus qinghaiensis]
MARPVEPAPLEGPVRFGPYTLVRRIGAGGMGEVFLAREEAPRRACVVKKVLPQLMESPQFVGRFRDEARVVVRLTHPNIARVYAMGEVEGQLYLSMEYVRGKTLSRLSYRLRQLGRMMPLGIILHLGERLCEGLAYAHDATDEEGHALHLVHRDLSPANVCISYDGEVKIIDFGAAQSTLKEQQTAPRVVIGNLTYMSPEQARKRFVDRRADVYAVGVLLWELCAWKPLSQRGDPVERWRRAAYPTWENAGKHRPGLPSSVDAFLMRALTAEPANRFPDAAAMGAELARLKAKLSPGVGDAELARLLAIVFPREKKAEETLLEELLREEARRTHTEPELVATLTPPTALAFEHNAIYTPDDFVLSERAQVGPRPATDDEPTRAGGGSDPGDDEPTRAGGGRRSGDDEPTHVAGARGPGEDEPTHVAGARGPGEDEPTHVAGERGPGEDEPTHVAGARGPGDDEPTQVAGGRRPGDDEPTRAGGGLSPGEDEPTRAGGWGSSDEDEPTAVGAPPRVDLPRAGFDDPSATVPLGAEDIASKTAQYGAYFTESGTRGGTATRAPKATPPVEATEALDAAKVLVAIEQAASTRASGTREPLPGAEDTVTPAMASRTPRRVPRETQVGFGIDISQTVATEAIEARRRELVRAITGEGEASIVEPEISSGGWLQGPRVWLAVALFTGASLLGLLVAWFTVWR